MKDTRWLIVVSILCLCLLASGVGEVASNFTDTETSVGDTFQAWTSRLWQQTTQADFESGVSIQADTWSSPGDVGLAWYDGVFALQGGSTSFWKYGDPWASMAGAPGTVGAGGALAYDGSRYIYAFQGGGQVAFWRHDTKNSTWTATANAPAAVGSGGALVCDGSGYVYALRGGGSTSFWRYDPKNKKVPWSAMASVPAAVGAGGALAYDGSRYIYALQGNNTAAFWRYDTTLGIWASMNSAPGAVNAGGALAWDGSGHVYAFQGGTSTAFWMYDVAGNTWTPMADAPAAVGAGGALASNGSGQIYAFGGSGSNAFWMYDTPGNTWAVLTAAPGGVNAGGALAVVPGTGYANWARISSDVLDTGIAGDRWDALIWDETVPARTDIVFEVRASDTLFAADDEALAWIPVGGASPVSSGLPAGQYKQWRATLTTSNTGKTPLLHEVRLYYF